jgi:hypothetical protein
MIYNLALVSRSRPAAAALIAALIAAAPPVQARVFLGKKDALAWAFPSAQSIEEKTHLLDDRQIETVQSMGGGSLDSRLVTIYTAHGDGGAVQGHALIDIHNVRTHPEAFLIVLSPAGEISRLRVLAFHEPIEYLPPDRWLGQFPGTTSDARLRVGQDVHGIAGSTLTAYAVTGGIRRAIALYRVLVMGD